MGTMEAGFRIVTFALLVVAIGISIFYRHRAEKQAGALDTRQGGALLVVLRIVGLAAFVPMLLFIVQPAWVEWARFAAPEWLRWLGLGVATAILPCIYWLFSTLGNNISPRETTRAGQQLIVEGPYRYIRHPLYTFGGLFFAGVSLGAAMWWTLLLLGIGFAVLLYRTPKEEENLIAHFGDQYRDYMKRTGSYLPRMRRQPADRSDGTFASRS
jgi:protein-S-isoprenylcysteine O-methyltransferase Ste14